MAGTKESSEELLKGGDFEWGPNNQDKVDGDEVVKTKRGKANPSKKNRLRGVKRVEKKKGVAAKSSTKRRNKMLLSTWGTPVGHEL